MMAVWKLSPSLLVGLLCVALLGACLASPSHPQGLCTMGLLAACALVWSRARLREVLVSALPLISFGLFALLLLFLAPVGDGVRTVPVPLLQRSVSAQALQFLGAIWTKSVLVVAFTLSFARKLSERDLLEGLLGLRVPHRITALCTLMLRSVKSVRGEILRIIRAQKSRGMPRGLRAVRVAAAIVQVLLIRLGRRAELQALALVSRGYRGQLGLLDVRAVSPLQAVALVAGAVIVTWVTTW